jgi:hypothetical protein
MDKVARAGCPIMIAGAASTSGMEADMLGG